MDFTAELAIRYGMTPFDVLKQDKDRVIMLINYYIEKGKEESIKPKASATKGASNSDKNVRIRVNNKTATGGWF